MNIRLAERRDVDAIRALLSERIAWMDAVGIDQWNRTGYLERYPAEYFFSVIDGKELFAAEDEDGLAGLMALFSADERWPEDGVPAFYVHHLTAARRCPGLGRRMLLWAETEAVRQGKHCLRLDSAVGNAGLERFYTALGYTAAGFCTDGPYRGILREKKL